MDTVEETGKVSKRSKKLAEKYHTMDCVACGFNGCDPDHILNFAGVISRDCELNIWPLCRTCHSKKGNMGLASFVSKNKLDHILIDRGFWSDGRKWRHSELGK